MKTLEEMIRLVDSNEAKILTTDIARTLRGKKIQTIAFGYANQNHTEEFVCGELVSEWDYYRDLKEDCFPDGKFNNRTEYWASYMKPEQIAEIKSTFELLKDDGERTFIRYSRKHDYEDGHAMWCSDTDRYVFYINS